MLKIEVQGASEGSMVIHLEGQVIEPWVGELARVSEPIVARGAALYLDLSAVSFVSREGIELLSRLGDRAQLMNCSSFVAEQLRAAAIAGVSAGGRADGREERR